jgi:hypothetical protein
MRAILGWSTYTGWSIPGHVISNLEGRTWGSLEDFAIEVVAESCRVYTKVCCVLDVSRVRSGEYSLNQKLSVAWRGDSLVSGNSKGYVFINMERDIE